MHAFFSIVAEWRQKTVLNTHCENSGSVCLTFEFVKSSVFTLVGKNIFPVQNRRRVFVKYYSVEIHTTITNGECVRIIQFVFFSPLNTLGTFDAFLLYKLTFTSLFTGSSLKHQSYLYDSYTETNTCLFNTQSYNAYIFMSLKIGIRTKQIVFFSFKPNYMSALYSAVTLMSITKYILFYHPNYKKRKIIL